MGIARRTPVRPSRLQPGRKTTLRADARLVLAGASLVLGACAGPVEDQAAEHHLVRTIQAIVNGSASGAAQDSVVALARFENGARVGLCTATLVASNLAVTARHCVSATDASAACGADGSPVVGAMLHGDRSAATLAVYATTNGAAPDTTNAAGASAHGKVLIVDDATTICNHDLAFIVLDTPLAAPRSPIRLAPPHAGDVLTAVGFGITENGTLPSQRMQRSGLALIGAGPLTFPDDARYGAGNAELLMGESACSGDSGGPMLAHAGKGTAAVVGVASRAGNGQPRDATNAASTCLGATAHAVYALLGPNQALVLRAFAEAQATPWLDGEPDPDAVKAATASTSAPAGDVASAAPSPPPAAQEGATTIAPVGARGSEPAAAGGCSASGEPTHGAVEHALGVVFLLLLVLRLRGARRHRTTETTANESRVPYVDLGMRESFASLSDDR